MKTKEKQNTATELNAKLKNTQMLVIKYILAVLC